jgi:hypothetical protein
MRWQDDKEVSRLIWTDMVVARLAYNKSTQQWSYRLKEGERSITGFASRDAARQAVLAALQALIVGAFNPKAIPEKA